MNEAMNDFLAGGLILLGAYLASAVHMRLRLKAESDQQRRKTYLALSALVVAIGTACILTAGTFFLSGELIR